MAQTKVTSNDISSDVASVPATSGTVLTADGSGNTSWQPPMGGAPSGIAGGDLSGTYPNPTVVAASTTAGITVINGPIIAGGVVPPSSVTNFVGTSPLMLTEDTTIGNGNNAYELLTTFDGAGGGGSSIILLKANGTYTTPTAVQLGDVLGHLSMGGYGATGFNGLTRFLRLQATENYTDSSNGSQLILGTTPNGTTSPQDVAMFDQDGSFTLLVSGFNVNSSGTTNTPGSLSLGSGSGSNPAVGFNSSSNWAVAAISGTNNFVIQDNTSGTTPVAIVGGCPSNTLNLSSSGNIGIGTISSGPKLLVSGNVEATQFADTSNNLGSIGSTQTISWSLGAITTATMTASCTFSFSGAIIGQTLTLFLTQGGSGSYTATWPGTVKWPSATAPTLTATIGKTDILAFFYDGSNYWGFTGGQNY